SETSTGVLQDVEALAGVVREFDDVLLLVDAVTSLAGSPVETDRWGGGLDFVLTGSQKALALPPGLGLGAASDRMLERARTLPARGLYFDLVSFLEATTKHQPTNTPAISLLYALEAQLARIEREGGAEGRWRRHDAMRRRVEEWSEQHGIAYLPREGRRSWTVSCLKVPEGKSAKQIVGALKQAGWTIGSGYGSLKEATIRIGHMGDHTVAALDQLLDLLAGLVACPTAWRWRTTWRRPVTFRGRRRRCAAANGIGSGSRGPSSAVRPSESSDWAASAAMWLSWPARSGCTWWGTIRTCRRSAPPSCNSSCSRWISCSARPTWSRSMWLTPSRPIT